MDRLAQITLDNVARNMRGWIDSGEGPDLNQVRATLHMLESVIGVPIKVTIELGEDE